MKRKYLLVFGAGVLLLPLILGCRSASVSETWQDNWVPEDEDKTVAAQDETWQTITKTVSPVDKDLTLRDLAGLALENNPATRQAWESARGAAALVKGARGAWYPQVNISGSGGYQKQEFTLKDGVDPNLSQDSDQFTYGPSAQLTWLLLDLGGRSAQIDQALQQLVAANYEFNQAIQDLLLGVEQAYYNYNAAVSGLDAAQADLADADASLKSARDRVEAGLASKLEELQAEATYYNAQYSLEAAKGTLKSARADLAQVVGMSADVKIKVSSPQGQVPIDLPRQQVGELIQVAIGDRPDISALRAQVRSAEAAVTSAESDLWPTLGLSGDAQQVWYNYNADPELYDDSWALSGFVTLSWDIFSGFSDLAQKEAAQADLLVSRESLRQAEIAASAEVWSAYYDYITAVGKLKAAQAYLDSSQSSYDLALDSYQAGLQSLLDLLQAQSDLSSARSKLVGSNRDVYVALAVLSHATGRLSVDRMPPFSSEMTDTKK